MNRRSAVFALVLVVSVIALDVIQANLAASSSSECCNTCIGKTSSAPYSYDPVVFNDCTKVTGGVCCFDCGSLGDPAYGDSVSYGDDGVTAVVKAGSYISFTWSGVENVTYVSLKTGQKKTVTPSSSDTAAEKKSDTFLICAKAAGTIYFRGWGSDACREASPEHVVTVEAGDSGDNTCNANDVKIPTSAPSSSKTSGSSSLPADETVDSCNDQRASVQVVDGTRTCVCVSDWTNPPECDRWPVWKWLVTIGGALATVFSIALSVRAFVQSKKKKQEEEENYQMNLSTKKHEEDYKENLAPMGTKSDVGPLDLTPETGYHGAAMTPSKEVQRTPGGTRKPDERLFSL
ncbi:uncharacterized protein PITG_06361 [Phytophthora infestans T30-4]|uniref:Carbohydrate-binding protein n=2 Tax=Phytophthora infestans TaxID=4787 RepID=D0N4P0_PHYIT|nr:uncharacterized protein PITG_06361 [Phytophthora infestans T30-4]EEY69848.1 conserved hypothetical protein [Phytophthora infestans T30-4]KAF4132348.1 hypothetical protein GN958_ATG18465 [Phytophthora infestans]|eukprot:XP_002998495.1 conserved hypothetical protein [Phytophthora infestans T30-4]